MICSNLSCSINELEEHINDGEFLNNLTGSFAIFNDNKAARDQLGIAPLYYTKKGGKIYFEHSRSKLFSISPIVKDFPPGHYYDKGFHKYYNFIPKQVNYNSKEFRSELSNAIEKIMNKTTPIVLLSGGIDSAAVLYEAKKLNNKIVALTVGMDNSQDVESSIECCKRLGVKHIVINISMDEILEVIPTIIKNIESWNYSLVRNSIPTYIAMKNAKLNGYNFILTGDCADGVLAGQEHLVNYIGKEEEIFLKEYKDIHKTEIRRMQNQANSLGIIAWSPFIYYPFTQYIMSIPFNQKYIYNNGNIINKKPIRDAYKEVVPKSDRKKMPISSGAGMDNLTIYFDNIISDSEYEKLKKQYKPIKFLSKEHAYYFKIWKKIFFENGNDYKNYWNYGAYGSWDFYFK